jgi:hypothetical protein
MPKNTLGFTGVTGALQVALRHPVQLPAPPVVVLEDGESAFGVVVGGLSQGFGAGAVGAQLGHHVVELRCAGGGSPEMQNRTDRERLC